MVFHRLRTRTQMLLLSIHTCFSLPPGIYWINQFEFVSIKRSYYLRKVDYQWSIIGFPFISSSAQCTVAGSARSPATNIARNFDKSVKMRATWKRSTKYYNPWRGKEVCLCTILGNIFAVRIFALDCTNSGRSKEARIDSMIRQHPPICTTLLNCNLTDKDKYEWIVSHIYLREEQKACWKNYVWRSNRLAFIEHWRATVH